MNYKFLITTFCILLPFVSHASGPIEAYHIKKSATYNYRNNRNVYSHVFAHDSNGFYVLRSEYFKYLDYYNNDLEREKESKYLKINHGLIKRQFLQVLFFHDSIYMFYSRQKFNKITVYVKTIDKQTVEQNGKERIIAEVRNLNGNYPNVHLKLSLLHNKLLLAFETWVPLRKVIKYDFYVLDEGLSVDWSKTDYWEYNHLSPWDKQYIIDEEGAVHILAQIYNIKLFKHIIGNDPLKNQYIVVSYINNGKDRVSNTLSIDNHFIRDIQIIALENQTFGCAGFYSSMYQYGIKGAFFVSNKSPNKEINPINYSPFSEQMIDDIPNINKYNRKDEIITYEVRNLFYRKNGNIVLCGEQLYDQSYNNVNNILIVSFNKYGDKLWEKNISKVQSGMEYSSFSVVAPVTTNGFKIIYNENSKNTLEADAQKLESFYYEAPSYLTLTSMDEFGNMTKEKLFSREKKDLIPTPLNSYDMRDGGLIMYMNLYKEYGFVKLAFFKDQIGQ